MESFDGVLSHQNIIRQARTMISIKSRVLIKTVQLYSISNMTIKITGGPKWIVHCTSSWQKSTVSHIQRASSFTIGNRYEQNVFGKKLMELTSHFLFFLLSVFPYCQMEMII